MLTARGLRSWTRLALVPFVASSVLPRASMYAHHHDAGDHAHVHPWGEDAVVEHHHHDQDEPHHHDCHADGGPGLDEPDGDHGTHVHWQSPFQHATRADAPRVGLATIFRPHDVSLPPAVGLELHRSATARAPPSAGAV